MSLIKKKKINIKQKTNKNNPKKPKSIKEKFGPKGLEPTRYGDWEKNGRCSDF